jgi:hypothetical protein
MSYASEVLADAPSMFYRLGGTGGAELADASGNGRTLTAAGTLTAGAAGLLVGDSDTAVSFGGGRLTRATDGAWNATPSFSVSAWFKPSVLTSSRYVVDRYTGSFSTSKWGIELNARQLRFQTLAGGLTNYDLTPINTLNTGQTYYVAATYAQLDETTGTLRCYLDGAKVLEQVVSIHAGTGNTAPFAIGATSGGANAFNGTIDEVAYWNGVVLPDARIAAHYAAGTGADGTIRGTLAATLPGPLS